MKIKVGNFNFLSKDSEDLLFNISNMNELYERFNYFYMDGKEDTLYVNNKDYFEGRDKEIYKFEHELLKRYDVIQHGSFINRQINDFIKMKTNEIYLKNNYSRYKLYNDIEIRDIKNLMEYTKYNFPYYTTKIGNTNKLIYETNNNYEVVFNPYTQKVDNLEELYERGIFDEIIKANLILYEIENKKAPEFILKIMEITEFLDGKQTINILLNDNSKVKEDAKLSNILKLRHNNIELGSFEGNKNYELKDLKALMFKKTELLIEPQKLLHLKEQISRTSEDWLQFKIDDMKSKLGTKFNQYYYKMNSSMPATIEECILQITELEAQSAKNGEKPNYPKWYSKAFTKILQEYEQIKILEITDNIDEIKEVAEETGDNELQYIYYMMKGETTQEKNEEETEEVV